MGCDIHTALEYKKDGKWHCATEFTNDDGYIYPSDSVADDRNYGFFGAMANVRNGWGFAGVDTGDAIRPISEARGIPDDLSEKVQKWYDEGIEHTPSWHTLKDILEYDWTEPRTQRGWVNVAEWARFVNRGKPESWSGGISGGVVHVSPQVFADRWDMIKKRFELPESRWPMAHLTHGNERDVEIVQAFLEPWTRDNERPYCQIEWTYPTYDSMRDNLVEMLAEMLALSIKHSVPYDDVRIVFYFDS